MVLALHDHRIRFLRRPENEKTDMHFTGIIERNRRDVNNNSSVRRKPCGEEVAGLCIRRSFFPINDVDFSRH